MSQITKTKINQNRPSIDIWLDCCTKNCSLTWKLVDLRNSNITDGTTPLNVFAKNGNIELCQLIVDKLEDQGRDEDYETPYTLAVRNNHPEIVKMLIDKVDNPNPESTGMYLFYPYAASGDAICLARRLNSLSATANISKIFFSELTYNTDQDPFWNKRTNLGFFGFNWHFCIFEFMSQIIKRS